MTTKTRGGWAGTGSAEPRKLAVSVEEAAELLGLPLAEVERLARSVEPYVAAGGVPKWPLRELARELADCGPVRGPGA